MICIRCPLGCNLEVIMGEDIKVSGHRCKRGQEYAVAEVTDPKRTLTSTAKVHGGKKRLVSVKTDREISKNLIFEVMKEINSIVVEAPVMIGDVLLKNILGTDVNIVATCKVKISES